MRFFQTFSIDVSEKLNLLFQDVEVNNIKGSKQQRSIRVFLDSDHLIPYTALSHMEKQLKKQVFQQTVDVVRIMPRFTLSAQYTPEAFFDEYRESIGQELREMSHLDYSLFQDGEPYLQDGMLHMTVEDTQLNRRSKESVQKKLEEIFNERCGFQISVKMDMKEPEVVEEDPEAYDREYQAYFERKRAAKQGKTEGASQLQKSEAKEEVWLGAGVSGEEPKTAGVLEETAVKTGVGQDKTGVHPGVDNPGGKLADGASTSGKAGSANTILAGQGELVSKEGSMTLAGHNGSKQGMKGISGAGVVKTGAQKTSDDSGSSRSDWKKGYASRQKRKLPEDPAIFYGRPFEGEKVSIIDIQDEIGKVVIEGQVLSVSARELRIPKVLMTLVVTDFTDSINVKVFLPPEEREEFEKKLKVKGEKLKGVTFVRLEGVAQFDKFDKEITIGSVTGIKEVKDSRKSREDNSEEKRVELHAHTIMSEMDSVVDAGKLVKQAWKFGHRAVAITDHGVVQAFCDAEHAYKDIVSDYKKEHEDQKPDFKVIYGMEGYLVDDLFEVVTNEQGQSLSDAFVAFDIETTGLSAVRNRIIEIGAVRYEDGKKVGDFSALIDPKMPLPYEISKLTGITDDMLMGKPEIEQVLPEFLEFAKGAVLVAHNANFDVGFIRQKTREMLETQGTSEEEIKAQTDFTYIDTVPLARILLPELGKATLDHVAKALSISLENHHRAVDDAVCCGEIFWKLVEKLSQKEVTTLQGMNEACQMTPEAIKGMKTYHVIFLAKDMDVGRVNLYRLVSESHITYFKRRPRVPKSLLMKYREGLIVGSACEAGELYQALLYEKPKEEIARLVDFYDYLEIQPLGNNQFMLESDKFEMIQTEEDLKELNRRIVSLGEEFHKPVVATCDVHFLNPEDAMYRAIIMDGKGFADADSQPPLFFRTTEEMLSEFMYLGKDKAHEIVITNPNKIADQIDSFSPVRPDKCPPVIENSDQDLRRICYTTAHEMYGDPLPKPVEERLERELTSIIGNGFAVMYIIAQKLVWKSNEDGYLVGSRGSVGSSFAATMSGITEVNPLPAHYYCLNCHYSDFESEVVKAAAGKSGCDLPDKICPNCGQPLSKDGHEIPFETFLGFYGDKEPDIDLNFSGEYQSKAHDYTEVIFGAGQTFRAGTVGGVAEKTAEAYVWKYCEKREISKRRAEMTRMSSGCVGVKRTTGQHPGGIVVLPLGEDINSFTPIQRPANDMTTNTITTHYDYHKIDHNLLKLDILGHDDPTMIKMLEDLTGVDAKQIRMDDEKVLSLFEGLDALGITAEDLGGCDLGSLGIPEFGTDFVMGMLRDTKPKSFSDLVRISGLSHGTDVWLNNAQYFIEQGNCTLSTAICTRDDIMTYLIHAGVEKGAAFKIMESVRKGKGLKPEMEEAMKAAGVEEWYMESCRRIKYMFPKAHAVAYVMMAMRIAYFKVYYPLAYYAAYFSIRASAFNYELMCLGLSKLRANMKQIKQKLDTKTAQKKEEDVYKDMKNVQEMYARGFEFLPIDIYRAKSKKFQIIDGKLMPSLNTIDGLGEKAADAIVDAVKDGKFLSKEDFRTRAKVSSTVVEKMSALGLLEGLPETNQMSILDFMKI